jgi:catechol 2,3-dioxygenase-like lactoylglutathione lyase family enzyme
MSKGFGASKTTAYFWACGKRIRSKPHTQFNIKSSCQIGQTQGGVTDILRNMITGAHFVLYSKDAEADRAFLCEILGFRYVDVGHGWLIFAMPPAEAAIHPLDGKSSLSRDSQQLLGAELYLMCDDLNAMITWLQTKNVVCSKPEQAPWGVKTTIPLPSGGAIGLYQPRHATALNLTSK